MHIYFLSLFVNYTQLPIDRSVPYIGIFHAHKNCILICFRITISFLNIYISCCHFCLSIKKSSNCFRCFFGFLRSDRNCLHSAPTSDSSIFFVYELIELYRLLFIFIFELFINNFSFGKSIRCYISISVLKLNCICIIFTPKYYAVFYRNCYFDLIVFVY